MFTQSQTRHIRQTVQRNSRTNLRSADHSGLHAPWKQLAQGRNTYIGKVQDQIDHPADIWKFYSVYRLNDIPPHTPILLTGDEARNIFCYNPTTVTIGADVWCMIVQVDGDPNEPNRDHFVYPLELEPCLTIEPVDLFEQTGPDVLLGTNTPIPLVHYGGDGKWTVANNRITANEDLGLTTFSLDAALEAVALSNNQEADIALNWTFNVTSGTPIAVPILWPFQSSRSGTFVAAQQARSAAVMAAGDYVELTGTGSGTMAEYVTGLFLSVVGGQ